MNNDDTIPSVFKEIGVTLLSEGKKIKVKAEGYSMYPAVKPGSIIYIEPVDLSTGLLPGELIAWKRESGLVVHRLVRIAYDENKILYITRGDSSTNEDQPVTPDQIAGRVFRVEYPGGKPVITSIDQGKRPSYGINRMRVWFILKLKRLPGLFNELSGLNLRKSV